MTKQRGPARLVPPGSIIRRELEARGWLQKTLAEIMGRPEQAISEIISGKKQITPETARELACAFGTSPEFWMNLETNYRLRQAQREKEEDDIRRRARLHEIAPCDELIKRGWIEDSDQIDDQEDELCRFLGISNLNDDPPLALAARHSAHGKPEIAALTAWARRVEQLAALQPVSTYDRDALLALIPDLLDRSVDESSVAQVPQALLDHGVHFFIVDHLPQTYLDGAALWIEGRPLVALTLRYNRIDNFWFTLTHELAHIALEHTGPHLDRLDSEQELDDVEIAANNLAQDWLIDRSIYEAFVAEGRLTSRRVAAFAKSLSRHPAIVVGRLQYDGLIRYQQMSKFKTGIRHRLDDWIDCPIIAAA